MRLYLHAQLAHRGGGDPEALGLLVVDLGLLFLSQLLVGQILVRRSQLLVGPELVKHSIRHSLTGETEGPVLLGRQGGVDLLTEEQEILLVPAVDAVEVTILEVLLVPETIKIKSRY